MDYPTCGKSLNTERGMGQHHTKVHGDPLPNRTCEECGDEFYDPKARRTYCEDCYTETGEQNGNWKGAKEQAECERAGASSSTTHRIRMACTVRSVYRRRKNFSAHRVMWMKNFHALTVSASTAAWYSPF